MVGMLVAWLDEACGMEDDFPLEDPGVVLFPHLSEPPPIDPSMSTFPVTASVPQQSNNVLCDWYLMWDSIDPPISSTLPEIDHVTFLSLGQ